MPEPDRERLTAFFDAVSADLSGRPADVTTFGDGDVIDAGGVALEAMHLPGHTAGLTGFAFDPRAVPRPRVGRRRRRNSRAVRGRRTPPEVYPERRRRGRAR